MLFIRLLVIAITPAISIGLAVYLSDRYDKEPFNLLLKTFIFGALIVIPVIVVERILTGLNIFPGVFNIAFTAFIVAGLTEEFFKREVVLRLVYKSKDFNEKLDGIVYAVFSALGFATVENVMYLLKFSSYNPYIGIYRGILSVPAHSVFAVTMGYYLSLAKYSDTRKEEINYLKKSLYIPMILHGFFNFILMAKIQLLAILFIPYVLYLWKSNQSKLNKYIKESKIKHDINNKK
ncbi:MAG: PrsW family intramembrane metalloprotease [Firmicutes bacterium]|nr:PrsW family intramembrane metalloprotease [Bacillota bacterium]